jgi:hypothetical protein
VAAGQELTQSHALILEKFSELNIPIKRFEIQLEDWLKDEVSRDI